MKKHNQPIDDFFRDALVNHTIKPSEAAKEAFLKESATMVNGKHTGKKWLLLFLLSGVVIILSGTGLYFAMNTGHGSRMLVNHSTTSTQAKQGTYSSSNKTNSTFSSSNKAGNPSSYNTNNQIRSSQKPSISSGNKSPIVTKNQQDIKLTHHNTTTSKNIEPIDVLSASNFQEVSHVSESPEMLAQKPNDEPGEISNSPVPETMKTISTDTIITRKKTVADSVKNNPPILSGKKEKPENPNKNWHISTGIYYSPEWLFNILEGDKYVNNFGIEGIFYMGNYSIRTGAGLSITKGTNELLISYNDYLGNYARLDSMTFMWNQQHSDLVPTYYLSNKNVYDSLMKLDNAKIIKQYTYLQVPLILGYDFWRKGSMAIGLRAGPILSILLETRQITGEYEPEKNKIIEINQISPERIQTNWQIMGGINCSFMLSKRLSIELEPEVRYYFNSVYEKSDNARKPWSAGFRLAFHITY